MSNIDPLDDLPWDTPIDDLVMSAPLKRKLKALHFETLKDLRVLDERDWLMKEGIGRKMLNEINKAIWPHPLSKSLFKALYHKDELVS